LPINFSFIKGENATIFSFCQGEFFGYPLSIIFLEEGEGRKRRGCSSKYSQRKSELRSNPSLSDVTFVTAY
jgi:hypothetical protein